VSVLEAHPKFSGNVQSLRAAKAQGHTKAAAVTRQAANAVHDQGVEWEVLDRNWAEAVEWK